MHQDMPSRTVTIVSRGTLNGVVSVSYTAKGAAKEDIMRPYLTRPKWTRVATVKENTL